MIKFTNFSLKIWPIASYYLRFPPQFGKFTLFFLSSYRYAKVSIIIIVLFSLISTANCTEWNSLSPEQQQLLLPFKSEWTSIDKKTQNFLEKKTSTWAQKPIKERQRIRQTLNRYKNKNTEQRINMLNRFMYFESLPPEQRKKIRQAQRHFKSLTPEQKRQLRNKFNRMKVKNKNNQLRNFIAQFDISKRQPLMKMFKMLPPQYKKKVRAHIKRLPPAEKHDFALALLSMESSQRLNYIDKLTANLTE